MPVSATTLSKLIAAGLSGQDLIDLVASIDADMEAAPLKKERSSAAIRQERYRQRKASQNVTRDVTGCDATLPPSPSPLDPPPQTPPPIIPQSSSSIPETKRAGAISPRSELAVVLDGSRADAVIDHRQRIRKPLTAHAAKLLAGKFARCPDPNAAADAMIANGWQGFEPEWMENRVNSRAQPPPRAPDLADLFVRKAAEDRAMEWDDGRTIEGSYEHRDFDGAGQAFPRIAASSRQS